VLRVDPGDGPVAGTVLNLRREANVYRALEKTSIPIPKLIAERDDALLIEMAEGRPDLDYLPPEGRQQVMDAYIEVLGDLHSVEVDGAFQPIDPPMKPALAASHQVGIWEGIFRSRVKRSDPLAILATRWLQNRAPVDAERLVVCHGDPGPGNFMHDGVRVTALLDWEFVHVGDPMDDLGWLAFRGHHFGDGAVDFHEQLRRWESHTGLTVDARRISYYRIVTMYEYLMCCLSALDNNPRNRNRFTWLNLIDLLNVIMPRAMMEYDQNAPPKVDSRLERRETDLSEHLEALIELMKLSDGVGLPLPPAVERAATQILELSRVRDSIADSSAGAAAELTGLGLDRFDWAEQFGRWIARTPEADEDTLRVIYANGVRRIQSNPSMQAMAEKPLLHI